MKNSRRSAGLVMAALDQRFGIEVGLKVLARLRARPVRQARMKSKWMMVR